jgi:hypothetical protein
VVDLSFVIAAVGRWCGGLWRCLTVRACGRTQVELERVRNEGTAQVIILLPPGAELFETEPGGRTRVIRMPHQAPPAVIVPGRLQAGRRKENHFGEF